MDQTNNTPTPRPDPAPTVDSSVTVDGPGEQIGRYKILQLIGEGGFGSVYMAEQEEPVRRKVALKIIKLGMDTKQVIARFEAERQALALMDHPNIARVLDAGSTEAGRPYFVMELVRGVPVTEYCDKNKLSTRERLELFNKICQAIQHAHHKGIIHRDIKPTNVLVTLHDGVPVPKVIDFGIAKALHQRLTDKTLFTEYHQFMGTPVYMSPEQAEMSGLDVDARTDIYSLGVLLYELLTGTTPFDAQRLKSLSRVDIQKLIREENPHKPSTRIQTLGQDATSTAEQQQTDSEGLRRHLKGDLDCIVMKALEKDRTRRYETANGFMFDVRRYLDGEAVLASPPSAIYRARKFVGRHRVGVAVTSVVGLALFAGMVLATIGFAQARKERAVARAEAESARAINSFFADMLGSVDPRQLRLHSAFAPEGGVAGTTVGGFDRNISVVEMLKRGGERLEETFQGKPELEAEARETIGITLLGLGRLEDATPHLERAVEIRSSILPEDHPDRLRSELQLGYVLMDAKKVQAARDGFERVYGPEHPKTLSATSFLAETLTLDRSTTLLSSMGKFSSASDVFRDTLEKQRQVLGSEHRDLVFTLLKWGQWHCWGSRGAEAEVLLREAHEITQRSFNPDDLLTLNTTSFLGWSLNFQRKYEEGEKYLREALEKQERVLGPEHPTTCETMMGLGRSLHRPEDFDEIEDLWYRALDGLRKTEGEASPSGWVISRDLADFLLRRGKTNEAIQLYRQCYDACLDAHGQSNSWTTGAEGYLLAGLRAAGRHEEAQAHVADHLTDLRRRAESDGADAEVLNDYAWELLTCWSPELRDPRTALPVAEKALGMAAKEDSSLILDTLARAYQMTGNLSRAIETQRQAVEQLESRSTPDADDIVLELIRYLTLSGDVDAAMKEARLQIRARRQQADSASADIAEDLRDFGESLVDEGLWAAAEVVLSESSAVYEGMAEPDPDDHAQALVLLCGSLSALGRIAEVNERLAQAEELVIETHGESSLDLAEEVLYPIGLRLSRGDRGTEAVPIFRRVIEICEALGEDGTYRRQVAELHLAKELVHLGETKEAMRLGRSKIGYWREERGEVHWTTGWAKENVGLALLRAGDVVSAEKMLREALHAMRFSLEERNNPVGFAGVESGLAECLTRQGQFVEAESLLLGAHELIDEYGKDRPRSQRMVLEQLVALYEKWGKPAEVDKWATTPFSSNSGM